VLGVISLTLFWFADPLFLRAPKDRTLIAVFHRHRAAFTQLRKLAAADSDGYFSESYLGGGFSAQQQQECKKLLSEIDSGLIVTTSPQTVRFVFASGGLSAIGPEWLKGIEYISGDPAREGVVVKTLDHPASLPFGGVYLRPIAPRWFLVFQNTD